MKDIRKQYIEICRIQFPRFVETVEEQSFDYGNHRYRAKEKLFEFALELIEMFGPCPTQKILLSEEWYAMFDEWNEWVPPDKNLDSFEPWTDEEASDWFMSNSEIANL